VLNHVVFGFFFFGSYCLIATLLNRVPANRNPNKKKKKLKNTGFSGVFRFSNSEVEINDCTRN
jgi:hypothetical protein